MSNKSTYNVSLPVELMQAVEVYQEQERRSRSAMVEVLLTEAIAARGRPSTLPPFSDETLHVETDIPRLVKTILSIAEKREWTHLSVVMGLLISNCPRDETELPFPLTGDATLDNISRLQWSMYRNVVVEATRYAADLYSRRYMDGTTHPVVTPDEVFARMARRAFGDLSVDPYHGQRTISEVAAKLQESARRLAASEPYYREMYENIRRLEAGEPVSVKVVRKLPHSRKMRLDKPCQL